MQSAQTYLEVVRSRGERRLELERVYRNLQNPELFMLAYGKLYANQGAMTPGIDPNDTVDGMSTKVVDEIIKDLEQGTYQWKPVRRTYIAKKNSSKKRPLGIPSWRDKLLQEVLRKVLATYYEPQFYRESHGFRQGHGCHTALRSITNTWKGTKWFVEGDIRGCFDNIDHDKLLEIIGRKIKDERLLKLLRGMLDAGYLEDWKYYNTYSGTPQGGVVSPLLANIFLNELDTYVAEVLIPEYTRGETRTENPEYVRLASARKRARKAKDIERSKELTKELRKLSYGVPDDPEYRRLRYVRYADDFLLGFIGPKAEAEEIKQKIRGFLQALRLELSEEKTLITNATTGHARFLGYDIYMARNNNQIYRQIGKAKRRTINGAPQLSVPSEVVQRWTNRYAKGGKPSHRPELQNYSDYDIVMTYNMEFQGLVNYYTMAQNVANKLYRVKYAYLQSLVKTLAVKHKQRTTWVYQNYYHKQPKGVAYVEAEVPRPGKQPLVAKFGAKPIHYDKKAVINDQIAHMWIDRNELVKRVDAQTCELCGASGADIEIEVHHIRKLRDLQRKYQGRPDPPQWVARMIEIRRKTLVVCVSCHRRIHNGAYDGPKLTQVADG